MQHEMGRRAALKLGGAGALALAMPAIGRADDYPSRSIILVNPYPPGGYVDNLSRAMAPALGEAFGQPVSVINTPGANGMLGHEYFLKQPDDGYTLLADSANFIDLNILLQKAPFKVGDFQMINLPARDYTLMATAKANDKLHSIGDVMSALKADPGSLSIGVQRAASDYVNLILLMRSAGIDTTKLRLVTFDGGGPTRTATLGGVVDVGLTGGEGFLPVADNIRPLLTFDTKRREPFDSPSLSEVHFGPPFQSVAGSIRGFLVSTSFKTKHPDRYAKVLSVFEKVFKDPKVVTILNNAQLASTWYGPENSQALYLQTYELMKQNLHLLKAS